jgi:hypothetical protein
MVIGACSSLCSTIKFLIRSSFLEQSHSLSSSSLSTTNSKSDNISDSVITITLSFADDLVCVTQN